jgi:hypothetical protein
MALSGCHCLCRQNHPERLAVCTGGKDTQVPLVVDRRQVNVAMCAVCAEATRAARRGEDPPIVDYTSGRRVYEGGDFEW